VATKSTLGRPGWGGALVTTSDDTTLERNLDSTTEGDSRTTERAAVPEAVDGLVQREDA
jgi:hypothetical protein